MNPIIDHINRYVSNTNIFINFYQNCLGYELIDTGIKANGKKYAILKGFGHELFVSEKDNFILDEENNFRHIGYSVSNIEELLMQFKLKEYVADETQLIVKQFSKQFYIKDPDGLEIDLIEWTNKKEFYHSLLHD